MTGKMASFQPLRWLLLLLVSLTWATTGGAAVSAERGDFGFSSLAANSAPRTVGQMLGGHADDTMIHPTTATERELATATFPYFNPPHLQPGVFAESSWVKLGDVSHMMLPEYQRLVVGPSAAGHTADVTAFVTSPASSVFQPVNVPNLAGVQEFVNGTVVRPAAYIPLPAAR